MKIVPIFLPRGGGSVSPAVLLAFVPWLLSMLFMIVLFRVLLYGDKRGWRWAQWLIVEWRWSSLYLVFVFVVHYVTKWCAYMGIMNALAGWLLYPVWEIIIAELYFFHIYLNDTAANNFTGQGTKIRCAIIVAMFIILSFL